MTQSIRRSRIVLIFAALTYVGDVSSSGSTENTKEVKPVIYSNELLFKHIAELENIKIFSKRSVELALKEKLTELPSRGAIHYYAISGKKSEQQVIFNAVDLKIDEKDNSSILILRVSEKYIGRDEIFAHYPGLVLTSIPRGHSTDEETSYAIERKWGRLSFGFKESDPNYLSSIIFVTH